MLQLVVAGWGPRHIVYVFDLEARLGNRVLGQCCQRKIRSSFAELRELARQVKRPWRAFLWPPQHKRQASQVFLEETAWRGGVRLAEARKGNPWAHVA